MRRLQLLVGAALLLGCGNAGAERVARFQVNGHDSHKPGKPTVYVFLGTQCGTTQKYLARLRALEKEAGDTIAFVFLYPNVTDTAEQKKAHFQKQGYQGLFVDDQGAKIAKLMGATRTSEVVLIDRKSNLVYRGAIDDHKDEARVKRRHLAIAMGELLAGKKITTPKTVVDA
jgi:thiol-disulfide isomerase/thioredoxin